METAAMPETVTEYPLRTLPAMPGLIIKALRSGSRKPADDAMPTPLHVRIDAVRFSRDRLKKYGKVCGFQTLNEVPITYPQVFAAPLHLFLMTRPEFPFPVLGIIHAANYIEQKRALKVDEPLTLDVYLKNGRQARFGVEFDFVTEFSDATGVVWRGVTTVLQRGQRKNVPTKPGRPPVAWKGVTDTLPVIAPENIGRRYGFASQDYNPIHLAAVTARFFKLKQHIAHGMWTAARCVAVVEAPAGGWKSYELRFRNPLYLPGKAAVYPVRIATQSESGIDFALVGEDNTVLLEGWLR
jgi:acyl dehydratase